MPLIDIILLVVAVLLIAVVVVGARIARRRQQARDARLQAELATANEALAQAHASDNGWDRQLLEQAARRAHGEPLDTLHLVQVVDKPGTEADEAVFRAITAGAEREVRLGRVGDAWVAR